MFFLFFFTVRAIETTVDPNIYYSMGDTQEKQPSKETVTFTPATETHCIDNKCTQTIYSSTRFADNNGTKIEDAKSLMNVFNIVYLEEDKNYSVNIIDFNYTWINISMNLDSKSNQLNKAIPISLLNYNESKNCTDSKDMYCSYDVVKSVNVIFRDITSKRNIEIKSTDGFNLGSLIKIGENSTTVTIYDNGTGGGDAYIASNHPTRNFGIAPIGRITDDTSATKPSVGWERFYLKFNISILPNIKSIDSANLTLYEDATVTSSTMKILAYHMKDTTFDNWNEGTGDTLLCGSRCLVTQNLTWNNQPCGAANTTLNTSCNTTAESSVIVSNTNGAFTWGITQMTNRSYFESPTKQLTIVLANLSIVSNWNVSYFTTKEGVSTSKPYITIAYTLSDTTPPTYSLNSTNSTTTAGTAILHSLNWTDDVGLSGYIFSFDNCTGTLTNDTWTSITTWSNVTKTINSTASCTIRWCVYANDSSNNWNGTSCSSPFSYVTTSAAVNISFNLNFTGYQVYSSSATGAAMTNAQFNSTGADDKIVNASIVVDVSKVQDANTPMFNITNIGSSTSNITIYINESMPSSMVLFCTYNNNPSVNPNVLTTSGWIANSSLASNANQKYWCWVNFTSAVTSDTTQRLIYINATA